MDNEQLIEKLAKTTLLINGIIEIINLPGVEYTDGDCLDMIWHLLEKNGYTVRKEKV